MRYPVVIHKDPESDFGVTVPDLPGCFSAGSSMDEALNNAVEAIELHLEGLLEDGEPMPAPRPIDQHRDGADYADGTWAMVTVDLSRISGRSRRVNITLPEHLLRMMDHHAQASGDSRSGLIARAALALIASEQDESATR